MIRRNGVDRCNTEWKGTSWVYTTKVDYKKGDILVVEMKAVPGSNAQVVYVGIIGELAPFSLDTEAYPDLQTPIWTLYKAGFAGWGDRYVYGVAPSDLSGYLAIGMSHPGYGVGRVDVLRK